MLDSIIKQTSDDLLRRERARDKAYSRARKARILSKQAILLLHGGEKMKAEYNLGEVKILLSDIEAYTLAYPEMAFYEDISAAREEYSEASILYGLNNGLGYPDPKELRVSSSDYILGLADVPGELRRQTLDHIKAGDLESAEKNMTLMEEIYANLASIEEVSLFLKGVRRKLDVIRVLNERTRAEITFEVSRNRLMSKLEDLIEKL